MTPAIDVRVSDGVAHLTLSRPERGNALGPDLVEATLEAVDRVVTDGARMIVLRGAGKHFCTGFDLSDLADLSDGDLLLRVVRIETLLQAVHHAPVPTVAIAHGISTRTASRRERRVRCRCFWIPTLFARNQGRGRESRASG